MGDKLSHRLIDLGFFSVLGTAQRSAGNPEGSLVERGAPNTWDYNNGVLAVYDEAGRPWIRSNTGNVMSTLETMLHMKRGAHVPHSNDGGFFLREVVNKL